MTQSATIEHLWLGKVMPESVSGHLNACPTGLVVSLLCKTYLDSCLRAFAESQSSDINKLN